MPHFPKQLMICAQQIIQKIFQKVPKKLLPCCWHRGATDRKNCLIMAIIHCLEK